MIDGIHRGSANLCETNAKRVYEFQHNTFREFFAARKLAAGLSRLIKLWEEKAGPKSSLTAIIEKEMAGSNPLQWISDPLWTEVNRLAVGLLVQLTPILEMLFEAGPTLAARCYLDVDPEKVDHAVIRKWWTGRIEREERLKIVRSIRGNLSEEWEILDAGIFLTGETDSEVLYHCDALLQTIGTSEAGQLSQGMFAYWPEER